MHGYGCAYRYAYEGENDSRQVCVCVYECAPQQANDADERLTFPALPVHHYRVESLAPSVHYLLTAFLLSIVHLPLPDSFWSGSQPSYPEEKKRTQGRPKSCLGVLLLQPSLRSQEKVPVRKPVHLWLETRSPLNLAEMSYLTGKRYDAARLYVFHDDDGVS